MPLITQRSEALALYNEAAQLGWVIPAFGTENLTSTEAILAGTLEYGRRIGRADLPVTVAITNTYSGRSQSSNYTHTGDPALGLRLFLADVKALTGKGSPFAGLRVMTHLDHGQFDSDRDVLEGDLSDWSSVMFDASRLPIEENIAVTKEYVCARREETLIEGACDEITESGGSGHEPKGALASRPQPLPECTAPELAERYARETGVDIVVANLGTEHRAGASALRYRGDIARQIRARIGPKICLHGTSSVSFDQLGHLFADGICKVNLWTALERDSSPPLLEYLARHAAKAVGAEHARALQARGWLGPGADCESASSLEFCTTRARQHVVFESMKHKVTGWLGAWYV